MIQASKEDKKIIIEMLNNSFQKNATLTSFCKFRNGKYYLKPILEYSFYYSFIRNGIFLSDDKSAVAFLLIQSKKFNLKEMILKLKMVILAIRLSKLSTVQKHYQKIANTKPKNSNYLHFWYLGSTESSTVKSTHNFILELFVHAQNLQLPIYAETSSSKNEKVYQRYGFKTFETIVTDELGLITKVMRKEV